MVQYSSDTEIAAAADALAAVFRAMPAFPVVGDPTQAAALYRSHDGWSRHLLTGAAPPELPAIGGPGPQWAQAQLFFRERRRAEQAHVQRREREYGALTHDLLRALREVSHATGHAAEAVEATLGRVHDLLASNAVDQLRTEFAGLALQLRDVMAQQRAALDRQLADLHARVECAEQAKAQAEADVRELGQHLAQMREALEQARQQMQLDPLTELYNRGAFEAALGRYVELAQAGGQPLALVLLDIDHFKRINDRFGHQAGDAVLRAFSDLLSRTFLRADDFVARYGGEEFAILLLVSDAGQVERLLATLLERLRAQHVPALGEDDLLSCSGGYALLRSGEDSQHFFRRADQALYQAKAAGRACVQAAA
ncbi:MAG TPA: hypothetical protein DCZ11_11250 [Gammaproteobacteria bacterium]|uniref:GGDEF domain-containing protein n=1 Tax=Immundisolibacter sp. TaxID=1934948 RepID=UPI000E7F3078|nr:hypothetical protein [Gammaproteobacteria bacterium]MCH79007.1 hypothetical protein [Gammaproteobacteria bacterium]